MKTVLLADDHPIFLTGLHQIIEEKPGFHIIAQANNGRDCIDLASLHKPDIIITDISMEIMDGYEICRWANSSLADTRVIILSMHSSYGFVKKARQYGAAAFIAKEDTGCDLIEAMKSTSDDFFTSSTIDLDFSKHDLYINPSLCLDQLTTSELSVLSRIADAWTSHMIADEMRLSIRTIQTHRQNISRKLHLSGANSLLNFALSHKQQLADYPGQKPKR